MKVLIATEKPFAAVAVDGMRKVIEDAGAELVLLEKYTDRKELLAAVADVDALIIRSDKVDGEVLAAAPNLKVVVRAGAGYDNVDLAAATEHGVCVQNTPGQNSNAVAELVFGLAVMMCRNMYNGTSGSELKDKTLGIQAFGQVGRNVARIARGFEMNVSALDPYCPDNVMEDAGVSAVHSVEELYRNNKVVSIHIPATPETRKSIGYELITSMPKGGLLINTARKEVIDEEGLIKALDERGDIKYAADVAPDRAAEIKERFGDRVFFTPKKMGAQTSEANINAGIAAARQVISFLTTGEERFRVNK
ncbi:NAD(P)-dependent oxidoreductase [uncultured Duncaniella sp.]|uniref:NAD(P)-dependent oxidoreductase n=1 Tax=uncultured Duncaniella sp. TaxID=2768039 RepID=UPI0025DD1D80|nr:NAD(P)-dependent oxidoreductase [uncultured Duncaniella sp.]